MEKHVSVMKDETIDYLNIRENKIYVDCTLGAGGHSSEILTRLQGTGYLFAFDQDDNARQLAITRLEEIAENFTIIPTNFVELEKQLKNRGVEKVDGILFDIGVSSMQLDEEERGFSYRYDAPLDMRMNQAQDLSAYDVVNTYSHQELTRIFYQYGEEKYAKSIASRIIEEREKQAIQTTFELLEVIRQGMPMKQQRLKHPGKQIFQAIRIEVNDELQVFEKALYQAIEMLNPGGRLVVLTFHSLEDRICKRIFNEYGKSSGPQHAIDLLMPEVDETTVKILTRKPITASKDELENNPRAKSAKLRVLEKK